MDKIIRIGSIARHNVFCKIKTEAKEKGLCLSISGVVGPMANGDCWGSCGQVYGSITEIDEYAPGWGKEKAERFVEVWKRWHLNDMNAGCEHQREWGLEKVLEVQHYTTVEAEVYEYLEALSKVRPLGVKQHKDLDEATAAWKGTLGSGRVDLQDSGNVARCEKLVKRRLLARWKVSRERAGSVYPSQHPEGLLTKACPVCGYRYGSAWLFESVPEDVLAFLEGLPESDRIPAWV